MTQKVIVLFRSLTRAQHAARRLAGAGIGTGLRRTPGPLSPGGCVYCLRLPEERLEQALRILREAGVGFGRVWREEADGFVEVVV